MGFAKTNSPLAWDDLRYVLAVAQARSLSGAARTLAVRHSTVFRRIGAVEKRLGLRLFERLREGYIPTAAGEEAARAAADIEVTAIDIERRLAGRDLRLSGAIRIATADTILAGLLGPHLSSFRRLHPQITLEFDLRNEYANLTRRDADVAIRTGSHAPGNLVGKRIGTIHAAMYGLARFKRPSSHAWNWVELDWVGLDDSLAHTSVGAWIAKNIPGERIKVRANSFPGMLALARAGAGIAALPCFMGEAARPLHRLSAPLRELDTGLWLLTHPDLRFVPRVRAFLDFFGPRLSMSQTHS